MAGSTNRGYIREVKFAGGKAWDEAFPAGVTWTATDQVTIDGKKGYVPEATERGAPNTGNPWQGG